MSSIRTTRTLRRATHDRRVRAHVLRRDGVGEPPSDVPRRDPYRQAVDAGWRPLA